MSEELENAYKITYEAEKALVQKTIEALESFKKDLKTITDSVPTNGANSPARQYVTRLESSLVSLTTYDLDSVKNIYGLQPMATPLPI